MTDRVDSQEAQDVAQAVREIIEPLRSPMTKDEIAAALVPGVARLVREGQIRQLDEATREVCERCQKGWMLGVRGGLRVHTGATFPFPVFRRCDADPLHARIAALKGEG